MIVFLSERTVLAQAFCRGLSMFLQCDVVTMSYRTVVPEHTILVVVDGCNLHPQSLNKIMRDNVDVSIILMSDSDYSNQKTLRSLIAVVPLGRSYRDVGRLCQMMMAVRGDANPQTKTNQFSAVEEHVITALKRGASNKEIARAFDMPLSRVKYYLQKIYGKMGVNNRTQAALKAQNFPL